MHHLAYRLHNSYKKMYEFNWKLRWKTVLNNARPMDAMVEDISEQDVWNQTSWISYTSVPFCTAESAPAGTSWIHHGILIELNLFRCRVSGCKTQLRRHDSFSEANVLKCARQKGAMVEDVWARCLKPDVLDGTCSCENLMGSPWYLNWVESLPLLGFCFSKWNHLLFLFVYIVCWLFIYFFCILKSFRSVSNPSTNSASIVRTVLHGTGSVENNSSWLALTVRWLRFSKRALQMALFVYIINNTSSSFEQLKLGLVINFILNLRLN